MEPNYDAVMAWTAIASVLVALASVLVALIAILVESRRSRFQTGVGLVFRFNDRFYNPDFSRKRKQAAKCLAKGLPVTSKSFAVDDILDFFEEIAFYTHRGALDKKTVWFFFFSYMYRFFSLAKNYIEQERKIDPTIWTGASWLYSELIRFERADRRRLGAELYLTDGELRKFVDEEAGLV